MDIKKKKFSLSTIILISLLLGAFTGIILHYSVPDGRIKNQYIVDGLLYVLGNGFVRAMQMLVVPLVFSSLVCGSMSIGDTKTLGKVGIKTVLFYLFTTTLAITVALCIAGLIHPGRGLDISMVHRAEVNPSAKKINMADTFLNLIPQNPVAAMAEGNMLQIIFFSLLIGIILAKLGERVRAVSRFFEQFNHIMMEMTMIVMKAAPIGVFCLIAQTFAGIGFDVFIPLLKYTICVFLALAIQCFIIYQVLLKSLTGLNPLLFIKKYLPVMGFAFSTATSNATVPLAIETLRDKLGISESISSFTIPLGATINMDGTAIMQGVAVVFAAQAFKVPLTAMDYLTVILTATLASVGTAGVPGVGMITLSMVFASVGLPVEGIALIMGIDRILDMSRTAVNITGDAVCTAIVAVRSGAFKREVYEQEDGEK